MPAKSFPTLIWVQLRGLYGSGVFTSLEELHDHATKTFKSCPSYKTIEARATKEHWSKTAAKERVEAAQQKSWDQYFEGAGFGRKETADSLIKGAKHADIVFEKVMKKIDEMKAPLTLEVLEGLKSFVEDLGISLKYIIEICKLRGDYKSGSKEGPGSGSDEGVSELSLEEMKADAKRLAEQLGLAKISESV